MGLIYMVEKINAYRILVDKIKKKETTLKRSWYRGE